MSQYVSHEAAAEALDSLDDYARMGTGVDAYGPRGMLERYIAQQAATLRQSADSGRVGVTEAMMDRACAAYDKRCPDGPIAKARGIRAALEAALAAQGQGEHVGWVDEFGNTYPIGAHSLTGKLSWLDAHKRNWRPTYTHPAPAASPAGVPDGYVLVPREPTDTDAFMVLHEYQQTARTRKDAYRIAIRRLAERASERLAATPSAKPEGDGGAG